MQKHHRVLGRLVALLLAVLMLGQPLLALAEEAEETVTHLARATVALKVRREPNKDAGGNGSIDKGAFVEIIEYGDEWCKVKTSRNTGYVMTQYLTEIRSMDPNAAPEEQVVMTQEEIAAGFTYGKENFREGYQAFARMDFATIYQEPSTSSRRVKQIDYDQKVIVSEVVGDWCFVRYRNSVYGYMLNETLFKWDRIDPYAGEIPGLKVWPYMAFVNHTTTIRDIQTGEELFTVNPGAAFCVDEKDAFGRYPLPYWRTTGYITEEDVAYLMPVVPWEEAKPGDLISVMTTYFAVGKSTLQFQGRNWNIHHSSDMISGTVLQPGEPLDMHDVIGPYAKSTGYKSAPVMSDEKLAGYGGGTCQVNTTFYITTIQVPLLVTHRKVHANVGMYYALQGFDAAVGGGDINLTMVNTLPYAVRYEFMNSDGVLTCCIFRE